MTRSSAHLAAIGDGVGSCFGFDVHSALPLRYLRTGRGTPLLVQQDEIPPLPTGLAPMVEWLPRPDHPFHARLYGLGADYRLWVNEVGWFHIDPAMPAITVPHSPLPHRLEGRLWGIPTGLCFLHRGDLPLHASAVAVDGKALLLAAPGKCGKTTLAAAFLAAGHELLTEDLACLRQRPEPVVMPGPALLRIRRDVYDRLTFPGTDVVSIDQDRVYLTLQDGRRSDGAPVPLAGIVLIRVSHGPTTVERADPAETLRDLWSLSFRFPGDSDRVRCFHALADLVAAVPAFDLRRRLDYDGLKGVVEAVTAVCVPGSAGS